MELAVKFATVMALGVLELWVAIPTGTALDLPPVLNGIASGLGAAIAAVVVVFFGDRVRRWLLRNKDEKEAPKGRIYQIWDKYGVIGLGILAPLLTGAPLGAAIGVTLGAARKRLIFWMGTGIAVWTVILTAVSTLGFELAGF